MLDQQLNLLARSHGTVSKVEQPANIVQGEPAPPRGADEADAFDSRFSVDAVVAAGPALRLNKAQTLVVTHRRGRNPTQVSQLADRISAVHILSV